MARVAIAIAAALSAAGCAGGEARPAGRSDFLGDVSQLAPGKGEEPSLLYISPTADFSAYDTVLIDPVTVWHESESSPAQLPAADLRAIAERFESAIRTRMQTSIFQIVDEPRPRTLRIRAAFSDRERDQIQLDLGRPYPAIAEPTENLRADTLAFLRGAFELEIVDAVTGERLAAAIDDRLVAAPGEEAADRLRGDAVSWRDVDAFLDTRARRLAARLSALHQLGPPGGEPPHARPEGG